MVWLSVEVREEDALGQQDLQGTPDGLPRYPHLHSPLWRGDVHDIQPLHGTQHPTEHTKV